MLHSLRFCVCIFVHFYYRGYSRMLKMYSYLYLFLVHNDKVTNTQLCSFFLSKPVCTCMRMFVSRLILIIFEATIDQLKQQYFSM